MHDLEKAIKLLRNPSKLKDMGFDTSFDELGEDCGLRHPDVLVQDNLAQKAWHFLLELLSQRTRSMSWHSADVQCAPHDWAHRRMCTTSVAVHRAL